MRKPCIVVWHITTDFLLAGSGASGLTAALAAADSGVKTMVIEKTSGYGGSASLSGGVDFTQSQDLGTKGGLQCDVSARVLDYSGEVIEGRYVTGNCAGSVIGNSHPGAGSTIGPFMTFGYVAALHATGELCWL